jgi:hypothetical protein
MTPISDRYAQLGGASGFLGAAMTSELATLTGGSCNHYRHGSIFWLPSTGAHEVSGPIRQRWAELRWEDGLLGYPTAPPQDDGTSVVASFQHGTIVLTLATGEVRANKLPTHAAPNYAIPIAAYRVSDDDGGRPCPITPGEIGQWVDEASRVYAAGGVRFTYDGVLNDLHDTQVNNLQDDQDPNWLVIKDRLNALAAQTRRIVVVFRAETGGGFSWKEYDWVAMSFFDPNALSLFAHELGHFFGLVHTFGQRFDTVAEASDYVLSQGSIDAFDGDRGQGIDDTPPDPLIDELQADPAINGVMLGGQPVSLARANVMSYWSRHGPAQLSHSQIVAVRQEVVERNGRYLNVATDTGWLPHSHH